MSFTLPSVTSAATARDTGSLLVSKALEDTEGGDFSQEEYQFKVELLTTENGTPLNRTFSYSLTNSENSTTMDYCRSTDRAVKEQSDSGV